MELVKLHQSEQDIFIGYAESRIGGRPENQDSYGFMQTKFGFVVTVCDGMGGGPGGKTASTIAVREILTVINESGEDEEINDILVNSVRKANISIITAGTDNEHLRGMGSTATVLLLTEQSAFVAHVGDSRIYQIRGKHKVFRTFDHSVVFDMVKQHIITEEQARLSAQSNIITRALGIKPDLEVDVAELPYEKGDRFILCSDGIHGSMSEKNLVKMFSNRRVALGPILDDIATCVDNIGRSNGGHHDNLTISIIEMKYKSKLRPPMSKRIKITMLMLTVISIVSIIGNIILATGNSSSAVVLPNDSVRIEEPQQTVSQFKDSVQHKELIINDLK